MKTHIDPVGYDPNDDDDNEIELLELQATVTKETTLAAMRAIMELVEDLPKSKRSKLVQAILDKHYSKRFAEYQEAYSFAATLGLCEPG